MNRGKYFKWLLKLVDCNAETYGYLMVALFNKEFYWTINADENRAEDGKNLRYIFLEETECEDCKDESEMAGPCSVLEMLIALARRWQMDIVSEDGSANGFEKNFWEMLTNLGFENCKNEDFVPEIVDEKLNIWLDRDYSEEGIGGIFPVIGSSKNQTGVEMWYQLQEYLMKKG